ncbi:MAG: ROK family glucokinase [Firmicutes bacterium]|nr:ROK family glucokinase [Bacillota bacterium]
MNDKFCFGVDVGGTAIKIGLFSNKLELIEKWSLPTPRKGRSSEILPFIVYNIKKIMADRELKDCMGMGICVPGPVLNDGTVLSCVNLGWDEFNIKEKIKSMLGFNVWAGNDANAAAFGEVRIGLGVMDAVMITLGTGIGGGIIHNGKIIVGSNGSAGEIGHINVAGGEGFTCGCGKNGCVETVASGVGIANLAKRMISYYKGETVLKPENLSAAAIFAAAKNGDEFANLVVRRAMRYLAKAMANISAVIDPEAFIIGGGVSKAGTFLTDILSEEYEKVAFSGNKNKKILLAKLGENAGIYGAAAKLVECMDGALLDYAFYQAREKS